MVRAIGTFAVVAFVPDGYGRSVGIDRAVELELIPALRSLGIGLIPYSPLHAGLLAGVL